MHHKKLVQKEQSEEIVIWAKWKFLIKRCVMFRQWRKKIIITFALFLLDFLHESSNDNTTKFQHARRKLELKRMVIDRRDRDELSTRILRTHQEIHMMDKKRKIKNMDDLLFIILYKILEYVFVYFAWNYHSILCFFEQSTSCVSRILSLFNFFLYIFELIY